jgi:hypothetical protein
MELLDDVGQVEGRFGLHGDGVNLGRIDARFATNVPWSWKLFLVYPIKLLVNVDQMEARSVCLEIVLISTHDWSTICAKCPIHSKIILGTPNGTPR